jgi:GTPase
MEEPKREDKYIDQLRIGVLGNVDSGKTTLISVISHKILDNGRGLARKKVLKHNHEQETGRTSSITHTYYRADETKLISFIDLAGHEKYYKTTIFGANCCSLDYIVLLVGANMGVSRMTREHLLLTFILKLPFIVIITKTDIAPKNVLQNTLSDLEKLIRKYKPDHSFVCLDSSADFKNFPKGHLNLRKEVPYLKVSNTTGDNIDLVTNYLNSLEIYQDWVHLKSQNELLIIEDVYQVNGVGVVVTGTLNSGVINKGDKLMIGPIDGSFFEVTVKSMHDNYKNVIDKLLAGCSGCLCIKSNEKKMVMKKAILRRGMNLISKTHDKFTTDKFVAKVKILHHPTTIKKNYEPIVHCGSIRPQELLISIKTYLERATNLL